MNDTLIFLTPVLAFIILTVAFRFTGCASFTEGPSTPDTVTDPPAKPPPGPVVDDPVVVPPTPPPAKSYADVVVGYGPAFAALWPLNEKDPNIAYVLPLTNSQANGVYTSAPTAVGDGYKLGNPGVLSHKDMTDFSPSFEAGYVQVPFLGPLNPPKGVAFGFTVELWAKPNPNLGGETQVLVSSHRFNSPSDQQGYEIALVKPTGQTAQRVRVRVFGNVGTPTEALLPVLTGDPGEWRHIALIYTFDMAGGGKITAYGRVAKSTNGSREGPHIATYEAVTSANPSTLRFGAGHATGQGPTNLFVGQIDNVAFYNAALDQLTLDEHFKFF